MSNTSTPATPRSEPPPTVIDAVYKNLPVHIAAIKGDKDQLKQILKTQQDSIDSVCEADGTSPIHLAARYGNARCVRLLLKSKANCNAKDKQGNTPLHLAAAHNHRRSAELLLGAGAQANEANSEGWCPIHEAIKAGNTHTVNLLLEKGVSPDECAAPGGPCPIHPLIIATENKQAEIAKLLAQKCKNLNPTDHSGRTPMHIASANGLAEVVGALVMRGANVNAADNQGIVPLQLAINGDFDDICHTLTTNGADVSLRYTAGRPRKQSDADAIDMVMHADRYGYLISSSSSPIPSSLYTAALKSSSSTSTASRSTLKSTSSSEDDVDIDDSFNEAGNGNSKAQARKLRKELERAKKWSKMIKTWDNFLRKKPTRIITRSEKGIPDCVRGEAWKLLSGANTQMSTNKDKYENLCGRPSKWVTQIDLDVNRSSRNHLQFKERYGKGQVALFRALKAYSVYDEEVGYCQGMSDITSLLLKYVTEQEAFWMLERLMYDPKYNMRELMLPGFPRLQSTFLIHDALLKEYAPALAAHLAKENVVPAFYATKWYLMAFLDIFPFDITLRLWDVLFAEGYDIVLSIGINVLIMFQDQMIGKSFDKIMAFLRSLETDIKMDTDKFLAAITRNKISTKKIKRVEEKLKESPKGKKKN